jgi:DNA polymerase elongation subunit (family B)
MSNTVFYTNIAKRGNSILLRGYDTESKRQIQKKIPYQPYLYVHTPDGHEPDATSIKGIPLSKMNFDNMKDMDEFMERYKEVLGFKFYGMKKPVYQFISEFFEGDIEYDPSLIRGTFLDIEVFSGDISEDGKPIAGPFPHAEQANYPINAITAYTTDDGIFHTFALETFKDKKIGTWSRADGGPRLDGLEIKYHGFDTEFDLLNAFIQFWSAKQLDWYSGWNSTDFDMTYMVNRIKNQLGEDRAKELSPWGIIYPRTEKDKFGGEIKYYDVMGIAALDMKMIFEKHGFIQPENWKLNTVAQLILDEEKLSYDDAGGLNTLYITDFKHFINYNIIDANLVKRLDDMKQFMLLTYTIAYLTKSNYEDTVGTVAPWSSLLYDFLKNKNTFVEIKAPQPETASISGGFVKSPILGKHLWVVNGDYDSLYPHVEQQYNMGPETILEPEEIPAELRAIPNFTIDDLLNKRVDLSLLKKYDVCMSANRQFFRRNKISCLNEITRKIYSGRKAVKGEMKKVEQQEIDCVVLTQKTIYKAIISSMNAKQNSLKVVLNAGYGALCNRWFTEFYDKRIAEGITLSGQLAITWVGRKLDEWMNSILGTGTVTHRYGIGPDGKVDVMVTGTSYIVYSDTDSVYIKVEGLVEKLFGKDPDIWEVTEFLDKVFKEKIQAVINEATAELAEYVNAHENRMFMKRENIAPAAIWTAKKRYTMLVTDSEGVRYKEPKLKITGLDAIKGTVPKRSREWLKDCYKIALTKDEKALQAFVKEKKKEFYSLDAEEIAKIMTCNKLQQYHDDRTVYIKGAPRQVKAALYHNLLIKNLGMMDVPAINSGEKIMLIGLKKNNPYGIDVIGFQTFMPKEFNLHKFVDYDSNWDANFIEPLNNLLQTLNWYPEAQASIMDFFS